MDLAIFSTWVRRSTALGALAALLTAAPAHATCVAPAVSQGLQTGLTRSFYNGLSFQLSYTWSKAIDNADFTGGIYGFVPNTFDSSPERGRANFELSSVSTL